MAGLEGVVLGVDLVAGRLLTSLTSGTPPSLAWTVRSCRNSKSRLTKVDRHLAHLKGRSLVSIGKEDRLANECSCFGFHRRRREGPFLDNPTMGTRPLHRLKGTEKLTRSFMSTSVLTPTECAVAELAFVLLFRRAGRFLRR